MDLTDATWPQVRAHYEEIGRQVVGRAPRLKAPGLVLEFEHLPPMTERPEWGAELTRILKERLFEAHDKFGLPCALRVTPTDIREKSSPPLMRRGRAGRNPVCAPSSSSPEPARTSCRSNRSAARRSTTRRWWSLTFPGSRSRSASSVRATWPGFGREIREVCLRHPGVVPGGDSACGFANTAMQLAGQKMLPEVLAAVVRAMSAVARAWWRSSRARSARRRIAPMKARS